jgi:HPr kinase/phosphorylase
VTPTIHATCLLVGSKGVLISGVSGAGKTRLALALIDHVQSKGGFARLVADDRVHVAARHGRLVARAPEVLFGLVERRGLGVARIAAERAAVVALIVEIDDSIPAERLPSAASRRIAMEGIDLPRIVLHGDGDASIPLVLAALAADSAS